jgi:predicted RNA-binding Zn-ribbon protein involved in translation (DUF1610 family)
MWYAGVVESLFEATATGRAMAKGRSLSQFQETFPDETSCAAFLLKRRWSKGFVCPGCGEQRAAALKSRAYTYECLDCGRQTSATAGTVMHRSKLPLTSWFWAAHLMATHSNGMSARQLEDQLGVTYKTAWLLTQKLRRSMVDPDRDPLEGVVEVDQAEIPFREGEAFFERDNAGKILVAGAVEVIDRDTNQPKPRRKHAKYLDTRSGRIRLAMIADNSAASIEAFVRANVKRGATLLTDGHASYPGLTDYRHDPRIVGKMSGHVVLPWTVPSSTSILRRDRLSTMATSYPTAERCNVVGQPQKPSPPRTRIVPFDAESDVTRFALTSISPPFLITWDLLRTSIRERKSIVRAHPASADTASSINH